MGRIRLISHIGQIKIHVHNNVHAEIVSILKIVDKLKGVRGGKGDPFIVRCIL